MTSSPSAQPSTLSRRSVAKGLGWSVPAVAMVSAAPAMAASAPTGICFTLDFNRYSGSARGQTFYFTSPETTYQLPMTVTYTQLAGQEFRLRGSGSLSNSNMNIGYRAFDSGDNSATLMGMSPSRTGLLLNQYLPGAAANIEFAFGAQVTSVSMDIYDITRVNNTINSNAWRHIDTVSFNQGTVNVSGQTALFNRTSGTAGTQFFRTGVYETGSNQNVGPANFTVSGLAATDLTMRYDNTYTGGTNTSFARRNAEFIAIGNMRVCT
ncbi:MAG: hypothetical protein Q4G34_00420 [Micrococcus sp.]|nr:hypothetical protein [Micrococcus sp.]